MEVLKLFTFVIVAFAVICGVSRVQLQQFPRTRIAGSRVFENSANSTGSRFEVLVNAAESGGKELRVRETCRIGAKGFYPGKPCGPPMHIHNSQDERFKVVAGKMGYVLEGVTGSIEAGQEVSVKAGQAHAFFNAAPEHELVIEVTLQPAAPFEEFLYNFMGLGHDYGSIDDLNPLQAVLTLNAGGMEVADIPAPLRPAVKYMLVPFAKLLGFKPFYPEYY